MRFSVVVPTYQRADVLERTLRAYLAQLRPGADELLVVDDGSSDSTPSLLESLAREAGGSLRHWRQENAGPAAARNRALAEARGRLVLFAGDDVIPEPHLLDAHEAAHIRFAGAEGKGVAVLGAIRWHPELPLNDFMHWLEEDGVQFAYGGVNDGDLLPPEMHYTSNLSVARADLPADPVFDPAFRAACWEDVDLGYRLAASGVPLRYAASARAWHWHPMDLAGARRRSERVGYYRALLHAKHGMPAERRSLGRELGKRALAPLIRVLPVDAARRLGYRWSLAWADWKGYERFLSCASPRARSS